MEGKPKVNHCFGRIKDPKKNKKKLYGQKTIKTQSKETEKRSSQLKISMISRRQTWLGERKDAYVVVELKELTRALERDPRRQEEK